MNCFFYAKNNHTATHFTFLQTMGIYFYIYALTFIFIHIPKIIFYDSDSIVQS